MRRALKPIVLELHQVKETINEASYAAVSPPFVYWAPLKIHISSQLLRCGKNFLLTYHTYAALRNFFHALHLGKL